MKSWRQYVKKVVPYVPGEQPNEDGMIKLNTNENPYPPSPGVKKVLSEMDVDKLRLYPDPKISLLVNGLAKYHNVDKEQVFVGVGSDDVLAMAFMTFFNSDKPILYPDITYSFYPVWCELFDVAYENPELTEDFHIVKEDYYKENGGIIIANPNAPTSIYEELSFIEDIVKANRESVVIIDEAYIDFAGPSAIELVDKYDNLLVVQTFSKSRSLAGMRIGYAIGHPDLIKALNDVKYSFNSYTLNQTAILSGLAALEDKEYFNDNIDKILKTRVRLVGELEELGFTLPQSGTNFVFARHDKVAAERIYQALRERKIYVRYFDLPRIDNYIRITVGTDEEIDSLLEVLKEIIN